MSSPSDTVVDAALPGEDPGPDLKVQLRLGFGVPTGHVALAVSLSGLTVCVEPSAGRFDDAETHLRAAGVSVARDDVRGLVFPAADLTRLQDLPAQVTLRPAQDAETLLLAATRPSQSGLPVTVTSTPAGRLRLQWTDGQTSFDELLPDEAVPAFLAAEIPFHATSCAWETLRGQSRLPVTIGRARVSPAGYVEVMAPVSSQLAEDAPVPGLFRVDDTRWGVPLAYADVIATVPGFRWDDRPPAPPDPVRAQGLDDDPPLAAAADHLATLLQAAGTAVMSWPCGAGAHRAVLSALDAVDGWPALILTPPHHVWLWLHHLQSAGRTVSLGGAVGDTDATVMTYLDFARRSETEPVTAGSVVYDQLDGEEARAHLVRQALHRLDSLSGVPRVAVTASPDPDVAQQIQVLQVLRPGEFVDDVPLPVRYPVRTVQRAAEHVAAYLVPPPATAGPARGPRRTVVALPPSEQQRNACADVADRLAMADPEDAVRRIVELLSAGPRSELSPKVSAAAHAARAAVRAGRTVALLVRHPRSGDLLRGLLRPVPVDVLGAGQPLPAPGPGEGHEGRAWVVPVTGPVPDLSGVDEVHCVDYPWTLSDLPSAAVGPDVVCYHLAGTLDDRLALLAARRSVTGASAGAAHPATGAELLYLLQPRWVG